MTRIYIDDSAHERGGFIISGIITTKKDVETKISDALIENGFDKKTDEFKSRLCSPDNPKMIKVRKQLSNLINQDCKIGLTILPITHREKIGIETLKGVKKIIENNNFGENIEINIDEGYFKNLQEGQKLCAELGLSIYELNLEVDSSKKKGIQLADLIAHTCSTMLLEELGLITKKIKAGKGSGYDPDLDIELGFELWANIRYNFLGEIDMERFENGDGLPHNLTEPYGLYISEYCDKKLTKKTRNRFSEIYLGCIH
ncbi:MAG: DUF3800 domain-containing protein [Maribacter stanieri]